jgi:hypothetical protein
LQSPNDRSHFSLGIGDGSRDQPNLFDRLCWAAVLQQAFQVRTVDIDGE